MQADVGHARVNHGRLGRAFTSLRGLVKQGLIAKNPVTANGGCLLRYR